MEKHNKLQTFLKLILLQIINEIFHLLLQLVNIHYTMKIKNT